MAEVLVLRCAACRRKLWRYDKLGPGEVLRCHKSRIDREYGNTVVNGESWHCSCGARVGIDKGTYLKMIARSFTYSGTKRTG